MATLWALQENRTLARYDNVKKRWTTFPQMYRQIAADPFNENAFYFVKLNGTVGWRDVETNASHTFSSNGNVNYVESRTRNPGRYFSGISARKISVGVDCLWVVSEDGTLTQYDMANEIWTVFSADTCIDVAGHSGYPECCFFVGTDNKIRLKDLDSARSSRGWVPREFQTKATQISALENTVWALMPTGEIAVPSTDDNTVYIKSGVFATYIAADPSSESGFFYIEDSTVKWVENGVTRRAKTSLPGIAARVISAAP
jgi:hypothetical protein